MIYKFKNGNYRGMNAQQTGEELERIRQANGGQLETQQVWREARSKKSPIHKAFTWDVERAAEERWAEQARQLIKSVDVVTEDGTETSAFFNVSVKTQPEDQDTSTTVRYYQAAQVLPQSPNEYASALAISKARLTQAHEGLQELLSITAKRKQAPIRRAVKHVAAARMELPAQ